MDNSSNVTVQIKVDLIPFGQATMILGFAHPDRKQSEAEKDIAVTQVMPLMSSAITPGCARPVSV
jgi:hypothetical protein